jgi:hypothetical protein
LRESLEAAGWFGGSAKRGGGSTPFLPPGAAGASVLKPVFGVSALKAVFCSADWEKKLVWCRYLMPRWFQGPGAGCLCEFGFPLIRLVLNLSLWRFLGIRELVSVEGDC